MKEPESIRIQCAQCTAKMRVPAKSAGKQIRCPKCAKMIDVPLSLDEDQPLEPAKSRPEALSSNDNTNEASGSRSRSAPAKATAFEFPCPNCGSQLKAKRSSIGKSIVCRECEQEIRVPSPPPVSTAEKSPRRASNRLIGVIAIAVGLAVAASAFAVYSQVGFTSCQAADESAIGGRRFFSSYELSRYPKACVILIDGGIGSKSGDSFDGSGAHLDWSDGSRSECDQALRAWEAIPGSSEVKVTYIFVFEPRSAFPQKFKWGFRAYRCR